MFELWAPLGIWLVGWLVEANNIIIVCLYYTAVGIVLVRYNTSTNDSGMGGCVLDEGSKGCMTDRRTLLDNVWGTVLYK